MALEDYKVRIIVGWNDPTAATGASNASGGSNLTSHVFPDEQEQHVFYRSDDGHVHELWKVYYRDDE